MSQTINKTRCGLATVLSLTLTLAVVPGVFLPVRSQAINASQTKPSPASAPTPVTKGPEPGSVNPSISPDEPTLKPAPTAGLQNKNGTSLTYNATGKSKDPNQARLFPDSAPLDGGGAGSGMKIAQRGPILQGSSKPLPGGSVQLSKSFKLFATQQLIHNLSFRDTPITAVIGELARRGNLNILIDKSVGGTLTGELRDVTLDEAMDSVLASTGMQHRILDNSTVFIGTPQAMVQLGLNRPVARTFKLSYATPFDVAMLLQTSVFNQGILPRDLLPQPPRGGEEGGPVSDARDQMRLEALNRNVVNTTRTQIQEGVGFNNGSTDPGSQQIRAFQELNSSFEVNSNGGNAIVIPDAKNLQVIVVGTQADIDIAEAAIRLLDRRPREVHIQASFVELTNQGIRQFGTNLALQGGGGSGSILGNASAPLYSIANSLNPVANSIPGQPANTVGVPIPGASVSAAQVTAAPTSQSLLNFLTLGRNSAGKLGIATFPQALNVTLTMLLQTNKAKLIANPSVVVVDNTEALITIASEVVHKVTSTVSLGVVTTNVELTKAGIFLNVLPKVAEDGFITMRLRPQVSLPLGPAQQFGSTASPTVVTLLSVRDIMSQEVRIKDGQTLVLGGLFTEQEASQISKIPYLAEAPVLGALFRNTLKGRNRTETMLLITPKIVEDDPPTAVSGKSSPTM